MTKELSGKIAFVTGSGRGLGHTIALRLAELGADFAVHDEPFEVDMGGDEFCHPRQGGCRLDAFGGRHHTQVA